MSVAALKEIIALVRETDIKKERKGTTDRYTNAYFLSKSIFVNSTIEEIEKNKQAKIGKLQPDDRAAIEFLCGTYWDDIEEYFLNDFKAKNAQIHKHKDGYLAVFYGSRSNFDAVTEATIKDRGKGKSLRERFFNQFIIDLQELLDELGLRRLAPTKGDKTGPMDYTSYFNLGHMGTTNSDIVLADRTQQGINKIVGDKVGSATGPAQTFIRNRTLSDLRVDLNNVLSAGGFAKDPSTGETVIVGALSKLHVQDTGDATKTIILTMESRAGNVSKAEEQDQRGKFLSVLQSAVASQDTLTWANQEASDSIMTVIDKTLAREAAKVGFVNSNKSLLAPINQQASKAQDSFKRKQKQLKITNVVPKVGIKGKAAGKRTISATPSYLALITLLNQKLPPQVRANMGSPRLNNVTGRLSESARVTSITQTAQGFPSIEYTYQRSPYDVFDKTLGKAPWKTPDRDPSSLISMSVRQLAQEMGMKRFFTRRAR